MRKRCKSYNDKRKIIEITIRSTCANTQSDPIYFYLENNDQIKHYDEYEKERSIDRMTKVIRVKKKREIFTLPKRTNFTLADEIIWKNHLGVSCISIVINWFP